MCFGSREGILSLKRVIKERKGYPMNNQEHLSSQSAPETTEEAFSLEEGQLNQVTGAAGIRDLVAKCAACFRGQQIAPQPDSNDRFVLGRTASGRTVYDNLWAARDVLNSQSHPQNWEIVSGSVHNPSQPLPEGSSISGHVLRPRDRH
jgi:hypothetical protein